MFRTRDRTSAGLRNVLALLYFAARRTVIDPGVVDPTTRRRVALLAGDPMCIVKGEPEQLPDPVRLGPCGLGRLGWLPESEGPCPGDGSLLVRRTPPRWVPTKATRPALQGRARAGRPRMRPDGGWRSSPPPRMRSTARPWMGGSSAGTAGPSGCTATPPRRWSGDRSRCSAHPIASTRPDSSSTGSGRGRSSGRSRPYESARMAA